ncbi:phosphotransferase family protein [Pseudonocardia sp. HH130630-07]|uniref:phosphotransferase family protein n=1 Tax=Pseudonocardia sp. HH130630-07 TaxID=1690815 RepID=UPI000814B614|nr:aminoglycoside phosphotransferase family protein [Pseudonocardia sp. HH130630-07]ANY07668.1 aminoglycoside phosphotransferase [Pseudonocardia sp. HH130630-07]
MDEHTGWAVHRPSTLAWVHRHLDAGERVVGSAPLPGGISAEMRTLTVAARTGGTRALVLRSLPGTGRAAEPLTREADALTLLADHPRIRAPRLVAVDATARRCEHPSLLMTHLPGRAVLDDEGVADRVPLLARRLVEIHAVRPAARPPVFTTLTTADTVVPPEGADAEAWAAATDLLRDAVPHWTGRHLHRDVHPGNVLFGDGPRITGVVDWAAPSWGPADLDVAHCATTLELLHGPGWGDRFTAAYTDAGGRLAVAARARRYWRVRDALAFSEDVHVVTRAWQGSGRPDLTPGTVGARLDGYVTALMTPPDG